MDAPLKERGDRVLRENGVSTSAAVRALWQELASTRQLPAFLQKAVEQDSAKSKKIAALESLVGIAEGSLSGLSDAELEEVGMARYDEDSL
jgi:DNA-damage-inducible protein J